MGNTGAAFSRVAARVATIGLDPGAVSFLQEAFKQFGVQVVSTNGDFAEVLNRQKFEACCLRLYDPKAENILAAARNSASNRRMVIYGIARSTQEALRYSAFGINAVLDEPLERQNVLKVVRAAHLLVVHELRRYVRIPVVAAAVIEAGARAFNVMTMEISGGGMSVRSTDSLATLDSLRISFTLPGSSRISLRANLCWTRAAEGFYGLRFDPTDDARIKVRSWIDQYLEIM